jgi:hypothetical protein
MLSASRKHSQGSYSGLYSPSCPIMLPDSSPHSRSMNGVLNGNIGVIKSMLAEITDSTNIAIAYGAMPIAWSTGSTLGYDMYPTFFLFT